MKFFDDFGGCFTIVMFCLFLMMFFPGMFLALLGTVLVGSFIAQIINFFLD